MRYLVCPYCFERFLSNNLAFRCINPDPSRCQPEDDHELAAYERRVVQKLPYVFKPKKQWWEARWWKAPVSAVCKCGVKTSKLTCPYCHNGLPSEFGQFASRTIALVGAKESGKSHYIAVLIHELQHRIGRDFNASLGALDDRTRDRYKQDFRRYLYDDRVTIPPTVSARARFDVRYPMVYRFTLGRRRPLKPKPTSLVFFDTAGEDLGSYDTTSTEVKYLANSDGIIFLLDPLQIRSVRDRLGAVANLPSEYTEPQEIIERVVDFIRASQRLSPKAKIKTPVALAFSKLDAIEELIDAPLRRDSKHKGYFDLSDFELVNDNMQSRVEEWVGSGLDLFMRHHFERFAYFGLSALGDSPGEHGRLLRGVVPRRVQDPLLWILYRLKVIPGKRR